MTDRAVRASSFGAIAEAYDRLRPSPVAGALDWLVPAGCQVAVDLAAGTGLLTRALLGVVAEVVAVEPDERMRAVLAARSPGLRVLEGRGEAIPLPDSSADGLFISSAWHWMDPDRAIPEIARVVRPGGRFGVLGTSRDRTVDWVRELGNAARAEEADRHPDHGRRQLGLPEGPPFEHIEQTTFGATVTMATDDLVDVMATYSGVIVADPAERNAHLERTRAMLAERFPGAPAIEVPMRTWCWRADRMG